MSNHEIQISEAHTQSDSELPVEKPLESERVIYDASWKKQKEVNHVQNLQNYTGFWHGTYFKGGIAQKGGA